VTKTQVAWDVTVKLHSYSKIETRMKKETNSNTLNGRVNHAPITKAGKSHSISRPIHRNKTKNRQKCVGVFFGKKLHSRAANLFVRAQYRLNDV
jgi:hypothetical protein